MERTLASTSSVVAVERLVVLCRAFIIPPQICHHSSLQGTYIDKKCPFTGNVSIRGRILKGVVVSTKMNRTIVLRRDYLRWVSKYRRYEKRHKTVSAHCSPCFLVSIILDHPAPHMHAAAAAGRSRQLLSYPRNAE